MLCIGLHRIFKTHLGVAGVAAGVVGKRHCLTQGIEQLPWGVAGGRVEVVGD